MSAVDVYLDVDGVLNAVCGSHPDWGWGPSRVVKVNGYQIRYSPEMVCRLNALAARPDVNMHWLTTWEEDAASALSPQIGLNGGDWPVLGGVRYEGLGWWKLSAIQGHFFGSGNRAVWIDDDLIDTSAREWSAPHVADGALLLVQPDTWRGLTLQEFDDLEVWIGPPSLPAPTP